uniref:Uncharacterized protein n=1 Tax=Arundo donax TaxID=35708 RepID=A0A0A8ZRQ1_ARUDO
MHWSRIKRQQDEMNMVQNGH